MLPPRVTSLEELGRAVPECTRCPRLIAHCRAMAEIKRRAFREQEYWGRPVPPFGDPEARLVILGLAPAAHGANRTGRMFTGDRSGDWLYRALHQTGFASQPGSVARGDGLALRDCYITASVRCAPPDNKPTPEEIRTCRAWLERELDLLPRVRVVVALGSIAFHNYLDILKSRGEIPSRAAFRFGHNLLYETTPRLVASYHPSQQNTSTGKLTEPMLRAVFERARGILLSS
jgi:uracil-DNA glycosylase family 4